MTPDDPVAPGDAASRSLAALRRLVDVHPHELRPLLCSFAFFFFLLASFSLMRPLRDAFGVVGGADQLRWLLTAAFAVMLLAVPLYGALASRVAPARFVPWVYRFFALNLLAFSALLFRNAGDVWIARIFFVWVNVFGLFAVSVFWSVLTDCFANEQARRLYGFIAAGGTAGTFTGPALVALATATLGSRGLAVLPLVAAVLLELALGCFGALRASRHPASPIDDGSVMQRHVGGGVWAGLTLVARSPYLLAVVGCLMLQTFVTTLLYVEQGRIVSAAYALTSDRARFFATLDIAASSATLVLQLLITGRLMRRFGVIPALLTLPAASALTLAALMASPTTAALALGQTLRRSVDYAIARPAREVLYTVVGREAKYKAQSVIETVVALGGGALATWLSALAGFGFWTLALPAAWAALARWVGRRHESVTSSAEIDSTDPAMRR